jgi:hypothetical protein
MAKFHAGVMVAPMRNWVRDDVRYWHKADIEELPVNVRFRG